jgi:hypothetical protein
MSGNQNDPAEPIFNLKNGKKKLERWGKISFFCQTIWWLLQIRQRERPQGEINMNKKYFLVLIGIILVIGLVLVGCEKAKANPETDFRREANDRGGITITGYVGQSKTVAIPSRMDGKPVTDIGNMAFRGFRSNQLTSVTIPNSVTTIGYQAFFRNQLTSVTFRNSVTTIGRQAFWGNQLTSITFSNSITAIGDYAFWGNQLTSVTIGANVSMRDNCFQNGFEPAYENSGKRAGTYVLKNGSWAKQ